MPRRLRISATRALGVARHQLQLAAEQPAETDEDAGPDEAARAGEDQETREAHPHDARQGWRCGAVARHELGEQERARALSAEGLLGAPHARVGLEGDPAQEAQDAAASKTADPVPDDVAR